jgi:hypothetical protein
LVVMLKKTNATPKDKIVLAFAMNAMAFCTIENEYFFNAFSSSTERLNRESLSAATVAFSDELRSQLLRSLSNSCVGIETDGAKNISRHKLIASGTVIRCFASHNL